MQRGISVNGEVGVVEARSQELVMSRILERSVTIELQITMGNNNDYRNKISQTANLYNNLYP